MGYFVNPQVPKYVFTLVGDGWVNPSQWRMRTIYVLVGSSIALIILGQAPEKKIFLNGHTSRKMGTTRALVHNMKQ